jgi:hypothetical protein
MKLVDAIVRKYNAGKDGQYIAHWEESRYIVISSFFFMIPGTYAYMQRVYSFALLLLVTSCISANYWRCATYSGRRLADHIFAKLSFTIFFINGVMYLKYLPFVITGYGFVPVIFYTYYSSCRYEKMNSPDWWKYHVGFHVLLAYEQYIILNSIIHQ